MLRTKSDPHQKCSIYGFKAHRTMGNIAGNKTTHGSSFSMQLPYRKPTVLVPDRQGILIECMILFHVLRRVSPFVRSRKSRSVKSPRFLQRLALSQGGGGVGLACLAPVALSLACCGLLQMPLPSRDWWIDCRAAASVSVPWMKASRLRVGIPAMAAALGPLLWLSCRGPWGLVAPGAALTHILLSRPWRHSGTLLRTDLRLAPEKMARCGTERLYLTVPKLYFTAAGRKGQRCRRVLATALLTSTSASSVKKLGIS